MILKDIITGYVEFEFDDGGPARGNSRGLHAARGRALHVTEAINPIEDLANDVERRGVVGAAYSKEDPHRLAHLCFHRVELGQCSDRAIEYKIFRPFVQQLLDAEFLTAALAKS